jgi:putative hydrolase
VLEVDPRQLLGRLPDLKDLKGFAARVREDGLATVVVGDQHRDLLDRVQCFMAVLEGYAEHVMDVTGAQVLDDLPGLRTAMQRRRRDRSGLLRLVERLFGMDLKMRQYEQGKAFCDGVVARGGIEGLNRVWRGPDALPTVPELDDPAGWLARTEPRELRRSA